MLQLQRYSNSTEWHWTRGHVCCIDNIAILSDKVAVLVGMQSCLIKLQCQLACLMEGHWSSSFSLILNGLGGMSD